MFCNSKHPRRIPKNSLLVSLDELFTPSPQGSSSGRTRFVTSSLTAFIRSRRAFLAYRLSPLTA